MSDRLHIYEETTNLFWGLAVVVCTTLATYILANSFITDGWSISNLNQITALVLFAISFTGILKLSEPLLHFIFEVNDQILLIHIHRGDNKIETQEIPLDQIGRLKFESYTPRSSREALFDFSPNYQLMWLPHDRGEKSKDNRYRPLIDPGDASFTLKVEDIAKIVHFIQDYEPGIETPDEQSGIFGL